MSNFLLYHSLTEKSPSDSKIKEGINLAGNYQVNLIKIDSTIFCTAKLPSTPLKGERIFKNERWVILFAGDLIDYDSVPFLSIIQFAEKSDWKKLEELNGVFSIFIYDKSIQQYYLISDRRSQHPVYYIINNEEIIFSTELSLFVKLLDEPVFNEKWLYDYLFFNFPVGETTFLKNVFKLPPASILNYDIKKNTYEIFEYASNFEVRSPLLDGDEGLEYASEIFAKQLPKYYPESSQIACALTNGWDGRTVLSLAPDHSKVTAYTYGGPGCYDIMGAKATAKALHINHQEINFDDDFLKNLSDDIYETVYLSSGLQGILRSTLLNVYKKLSINYDLALSGILLDGLFRGHGGYPGVISDELHNLFKFGEIEFDNQWGEIFGLNRYDFRDEIQNKLTEFKNKYGEFFSTTYHLNYEVYLTGPGYFGGEWKLANNFLTQRVPAWDNEITKIAYSIKQTKLTYSQFTSPKFGSKNSMMLQAYVMNKLSPKFAKVPFKLIKPNIILKNEATYQMYTFYRRIHNRVNKVISSKKITHLENWPFWINNNLKGQTNHLIFSNDALVRNYISYQFLNKLKIEKQYQWIGKLATVEIILRLIQSRWTRFW